MRELFIREENVGADGEYCIHHRYMGDFENACRVLHRLGVSKEYLVRHGEIADEARRRMFAPFFSMPSEEAVLAWRGGRALIEVPLDDVLCAWLAIATNYGGAEDSVPCPRGAPFEVTNVDQRPVVEALADNDYALRDGGKFRWTDRIFLHMGREYCWDETKAILEPDALDLGACRAEAEKISACLNAGHAPAWHMPITMIPTGERAYVLRKFWTGADWADEELITPSLSYDQALRISADIRDM